MKGTAFSPDVLKLDARIEVERIASTVRRILGRIKKKGVVLGLSGGIDSSVVAAVCCEALGPDRVFGILMPESESSEEGTRLARMLVNHLGIESTLEDITPILESLGCYGKRDRAIRSVIPDYRPGYKSKVVLPSLFNSGGYRLYSVVVESPEGLRSQVRLPLVAYLEILAANSFKQRVRKMLEYYHADRLRYAVAGTPNLLEYDQGFFVKNGDGSADLKPIAHLYKTQVYQLAQFLDLPREIQERAPTTDTFSLPQSQEEFYFSLPYKQMDLCLYAKNHGIPASEVAGAVDLTTNEVEKVFEDIDSKRTATQYLHLGPQLVTGTGEKDDFPRQSSPGSALGLR